MVEYWYEDRSECQYIIYDVWSDDMSWNEDRSVDQLICWYKDQSIVLIWGPVSWHVSRYVDVTVSWYVDMRTDQLIWGPVKNVDMRTSQLICWYEDRSVEVETILHHFNPISESWPAEPLCANELSFTHYQPAARGRGPKTSVAG